MRDKNEKRIINIIRYSSSLFIVVITVFIAFVIHNEQKSNFEQEKKDIKKDFISMEKRRVQLVTKAAHSFLEKTDKRKKEELEQKLRSQVLNAHKIATSIFNKYEKKSKEEIESHIKDVLRQIRFFDGRGYFFIYTNDGINILNSAFPKLEGKNLWNYQDARGTYISKEISKIMEKKDEVFYDLYWNKPNHSEAQLKVGFFKKFKPYNWHIGTGEYIEDFTKDLKQESLNILESLKFLNDGYIFILNQDGELISTKHKQMIDKNIHDLEILKELSFKFRSFIESKKSDEFIEYKIYKNIHDTNPENKISHIRKFDSWNWVIGAGFNIEQAEIIIKRKEQVLEEKYNKYFENLIIVSLILLVCMLLLSNLISKYLEQIFKDYKQEIEEKNANLLKAQEVAKLGDFRLDLNTNELYLSKKTYKIFGLNNTTKITIEHIRSLVHSEYKENFDSSISTEKDNSCIYKIKKAHTGQTIWVSSKTQVNKYSNILIGTIQDISDTKELELENLKKEKILYQQSKMASMGEMLNNIAHQWRQPLSAISTASTGVKLQKEMNILKDEDFYEAMDGINRSAQYLSQTIEDFRNFFNPKNSSVNEVVLSDCIEKALSLLQPQFKAKDIEIIKEYETVKLPLRENEFIQVLINILNNSKDAFFENNIDNRKLIFIKIHERKKGVDLYIYDSAGGINTEVISRVFEPYFTTKYKAQGTGIGLYMSQEIIEKLLKGTICAYNKEFTYQNRNYKGACFKIELSK